ncbi:MAG TPA: site-2 protease family protein [Gallionellaceae bacterium]
MAKLLVWLFAAGKLGMMLKTGGIMLISVFAYALVYGWWYAVGFVLLIFFHEMGHYFAARNRGLDVGLPMFIPFVGAWVTLKDMPHNAHTEAYVGFAGPLAGTLASIACYWIARTTDSHLMLALAYAGFLLNLINLIPVSPLDGGRITAIISPKVWLFGLPLLVALYFYTFSPMLILVGIFAIPNIMAALKQDGGASDMPPGYYDVPLNVRVNYAMFYLGLAGFLAVMSYEIHKTLGPYSA